MRQLSQHAGRHQLRQSLSDAADSSAAALFPSDLESDLVAPEQLLHVLGQDRSSKSLSEHLFHQQHPDSDNESSSRLRDVASMSRSSQRIKNLGDMILSSSNQVQLQVPTLNNTHITTDEDAYNATSSFVSI